MTTTIMTSVRDLVTDTGSEEGGRDAALELPSD